DAVIVFDANMLLNLYRVSTPTRESLFKILELYKERVWIPYQFASEFHENRPKVIADQVKNFSKVHKDLKKTYNDSFKSSKNHPFISEVMEKSFNELLQELDAGKQGQEELIKNDDILQKITKIFDGKVGDSFSGEELNDYVEKGKERFEKRTPPGFKDQDKKDGDRKFGDYFGWAQILNQMKGSGKSTIFVTDDAKTDWWNIVEQFTIGPRPELISEYESKCGGSFYMYKLNQFMTYAGQYSGEEVDPKAIEEVSEVVSESVYAPDIDYDIEKYLGKSFDLKKVLGELVNPVKMEPIDVSSDAIKAIQEEIEKIKMNAIRKKASPKKASPDKIKNSGEDKKMKSEKKETEKKETGSQTKGGE
ncbi:PIN domain-containing protein, partial [Bacteriovoracaceae bacterium]|nr:PIN domain-containing protein [Bacteriovoracaceae bacterium]